MATKAKEYVLIPIEVEFDTSTERAPVECYRDLAMDILRHLEQKLYPTVRIPAEGDVYFSPSVGPVEGSRVVHYTRSYHAR